MDLDLNGFADDKGLDLSGDIIERKPLDLRGDPAFSKQREKPALNLSSFSESAWSTDDPTRAMGRFAYRDQSGALGTLEQTLDYYTNVGRSAAYAAITPDVQRKKGESYFDRIKRFGTEALERKRYTSSKEFRRKYINNMSRVFGDGSTYSIGTDDDGKTTVGDYADTTLDFVFDVVLDPLTWATLGIGAVAKLGMRGYKYLPEVLKASKGKPEAKSLENMALVYTGINATLRGGLGGAAGLQATDPRDSALKQAAAALTGIGVGIASPKLLKATGKGIKTGLTKVSDAYALKQGEQFTNMSERLDSTKQWSKVATGDQTAMLDAREAVLEKLTIPDRVAFHDEILEPLRDFTVETTNKIIKREKQTKPYKKMVKATAEDLERNGAKVVTREINAEEFTEALHHSKISDNVLDRGINADTKDLIDDVFYARTMTANRAGQFTGKVDDTAKITQEIAKDLSDAGLDITDPATVDYLKSAERGLTVGYYGTKNRIDKKIKETEGLGKAISESDWYNRMLNGARHQANRAAGIKARDILKNHSAEVAQATREMVKLNREHMKHLNKELNFVAGVEIRGLDFHLPKLFAKAPSELLEKTSKWDTLHAATSTEPTKEYQILTQKLLANKEAVSELEAKSMARDLLYNVYARQEAMRTIPEYAKQNMKIVNEFYKNKSGLLTTFDRMSGHIKKGQLHATYTWLRTNLFDNVAKAFVQNGLTSGADSAFLTTTSRNIAADMKTWIDPDIAKKTYNDPVLIKEGYDNGIIDTNFFTNAIHPDTQHLVFPPSPTDAFIETLTKTGDLKGAIDGLAENTSKVGDYLKLHANEAKRQTALGKVGRKLLDANDWVGKKMEPVGRVGSTIENTGKLALYKRVRDDLLATKQYAHLPREEINKIAAKVAKDTFFDYHKISLIEAEVANRAFFYWAFHVKNQAFWIQKMVEPEMLQQWNVLMKARNTIGEPINEYQREGLDPYIETRNPRYLGRDGRQEKFFTRANASSDDAMRNLDPKNWKQSSVDKLHPVLKLMAELVTGHDTFTDGPLLPSELPKQTKYTFSASSKYGPLMDYDKRGNPNTKSDALVIFDKFFSTFFPHGIVNSFAGNMNKTISGRQSGGEFLTNEFTPYRVHSVPAFKMGQNRAVKRKEKND